MKTTEQQKTRTYQVFHNRNQKALRYKVGIFVPSPETMLISLRMVQRIGCMEINFTDILN